MAKILIVDDRPANRELLVTLLGYAGHQTREADEGESGLAAAREWHPDLIITDIVMPKMDGYEFARQVRADVAIGSTQIMFYTSSYIVSETLRLAEACGVSHVISKPIEPEEFLKKVADALASHTPVAPPSSDEFHREHMRLLTDTLVKKVDDLEAEIAERKQAEAALFESERHYRQIIETAGEGVWTIDAENRTTFANQRLLDMLGYDLEEMMGRSIFDFMDAEAQAIAKASLERRRQGINEQLDFRYLHKDGSEVWALIETSTLLDRDGKYSGALAMLTDITKRKQAEDAVRAGEQRYRSLFEDSPICIWDEDFSLVKARIDELRSQGITDFKAHFASHPDEVQACASMVKIVDVNRAALEIYEADGRDDMLGPLGEITRPEAMPGFLDELLHIADGHTSFQWERTDYTLKGRPIEVNLSWSVAAGHENDYSKVIVSAVDITERRRAELEIHRQLERLKALRTIDIAISSSFDLKLTLDIVLGQVVALLNVDAAAVLLLQPGIKTLEYAASRGFRSSSVRNARLKFNEGHAGRAVLERRILHIPNLSSAASEDTQTALFKDEQFVDYYCAPLLVKGEVKGVLEILHRSQIPEDQQWLDFLETLASQAAIAIENSQLFNGMQRSNIELSLAYDATIEGWSRALDLRDKETEGHSQRVTDMTLRLAQAMGMSEAETIHIRRGALLHDIGKLGVPDHILLKPGKLTDEEWVIMRQHPGNAYNMLRSVSYLRPALDIPYCHHEKWDGTGYPRGLKGEEIPLSARMFAIVDVWDALHSDRPYRAGWPNEKIREYILEQSNRHFDPQVVKVFLGMLDDSER